MGIKLVKILRKTFTTLVIATITLATTSACSNMKYLQHDEITDLINFNKNENKKAIISSKNAKNLGGFYLSSNNKDKEGSLVVLRRNKGKYEAETLFHNTDTTNYFFSFGLDHRKSSAELGLRLEF